jgi:TusA-related sulfurtransferase
MNNSEMIKLDCLGDMCPIPIMKLMQEESELAKGKQILLITDHSCVSESVKNYCKSHHFKVEILEPVNGIWEFYINL